MNRHRSQDVKLQPKLIAISGIMLCILLHRCSLWKKNMADKWQILVFSSVVWQFIHKGVTTRMNDSKMWIVLKENYLFVFKNVLNTYIIFLVKQVQMNKFDLLKIILKYLLLDIILSNSITINNILLWNQIWIIKWFQATSKYWMVLALLP